MWQWYKKKIKLNVGSAAGQTGYVAKLHIPGITSQKDLVEQLAYNMSIEEAEAEMYVEEFAHQIYYAVCSGISVKIDGFGTFSPSFDTVSEQELDKVSSDNIKRVKINFRPDVELQKEVQNAKFEEARNLTIKHV